MWTQRFRQAVTGWGMSPEAFWGLSWREWVMLTQVEDGPVLERAGFEAMMAQFPDEVDAWKRN